jgi:hypothetical protein
MFSFAKLTFLDKFFSDTCRSGCHTRSPQEEPVQRECHDLPKEEVVADDSNLGLKETEQ